MNTHGWGVVGVLAVLLIALPIGAAYAYSSMVTSSGNSISADAYSIDIYEEDTPIEESFGLPAFEKGSNVEITGYSIKTLGSGDAYAVCMMGNDAAWALIDSMTISFNGGSPMAFGKVGDITGVPSGTVSMTNGEAVDFTISITFADVDTDDYTLINFVGSKLMFAFAPASS